MGIVSIVILLFALWVTYLWGKEGPSFDGRLFIFVIFIVGTGLLFAAGYNHGMGSPAMAQQAGLKKGGLYTIHSQAKGIDGKVYTLVTEKSGKDEVRAVVFDNPPPEKFVVAEDNKKQIYLPAL